MKFELSEQDKLDVAAACELKKSIDVLDLRIERRLSDLYIKLMRAIDEGDTQNKDELIRVISSLPAGFYRSELRTAFLEKFHTFIG